MRNVGSLMDVILCTRLDTTHMVSLASKYQRNDVQYIWTLLRASFRDVIFIISWFIKQTHGGSSYSDADVKEDR